MAVGLKKTAAGRAVRFGAVPSLSTCLIGLLGIFFLESLQGSLSGAETPTRSHGQSSEIEETGRSTRVPWNASRQGRFITAIAEEEAGHLWVGTEDKGLWQYTGDRWKHHTTADGLGDNDVYAVRVDRRGWVWAGHGRHGVSVYNGTAWRNYPAGQGPIGSRVFDMAISADDDVWVATCAGLSRYIRAEDRWSHYTRGNGLPEAQVLSVALDDKGRVYAGLASQGIAMADPGDRYRRWRHIRSRPEPPHVRAGRGLPSGLMNDIAVTRDGTIYAATRFGLARSRNRGRNWIYARGRDWIKRSRRRGVRVSGQKADLNGLPLEDDVTAVAEDDEGRIWLGYRKRGLELVDAGLNRRFETPEPIRKKTDYVFCLHAGKKYEAVGTYGAGLIATRSADRYGFSKPVRDQWVWPSPERANAEPQVLEQWRLYRELAETPSGGADPWLVPSRGQAVYLGEDWVTQGDWIGRYGSFMHILCAMKSPFDIFGGYGSYGYEAFIGEHRRKVRLRPGEDGMARVLRGLGHDVPDYTGPVDDSLRYWIHWLQTDNPKVLQLPAGEGGGRRQSSWDDHAETYPRLWSGPHLYLDLRITEAMRRPDGIYTLAFYFMNKDGHTRNNRFRDYRLTVKRVIKPFGGAKPKGWEKQFERAPVLASTRVRDFWGGVYKVFLIRGGEYTIQIHKNGSFNTTLSGVFVDKLSGTGRSKTAGPSRVWLKQLKETKP